MLDLIDGTFLWPSTDGLGGGGGGPGPATSRITNPTLIDVITAITEIVVAILRSAIRGVCDLTDRGPTKENEAWLL